MNTPKIATSATGTEYTGPDPYPQCEGSGASPCSRRPDLNKEVEALRNAIRLASAKFDAVDWGWDGDCGSGRIIEELENILPENASVNPCDESPKNEDHA